MVTMLITSHRLLATCVSLQRVNRVKFLFGRRDTFFHTKNLCTGDVASLASRPDHLPIYLVDRISATGHRRLYRPNPGRRNRNRGRLAVTIKHSSSSIRYARHAVRPSSSLTSPGIFGWPTGWPSLVLVSRRHTFRQLPAGWWVGLVYRTSVTLRLQLMQLTGGSWNVS